MGTLDAVRRRPRRVVLHVGAPKSGTTFLQSALWRNREALLEQGVSVPGSRERDMFLAAVEVRGVASRWGLTAAEVGGTWRRLCAEARSFDGTTIMSHELLAPATEEQVAWALSELEGEEVHVVYTARDLGRQVTSEWQERLKNGSSRPFERFSRDLMDQLDGGDFDGHFWRAHDAVGVLGRWAASIPRERAHVVVCPKPGAPPEVLWHRFGAACGFGAEEVDPTQGRNKSNKTLGVVEASLLREVNQALQGRIPQPTYSMIVKRQFAQKLLAEFSSPAATCPEGLLARLVPMVEEHNDVLRSLGYRVHGDLDELIPDPPAGEALNPDRVGVQDRFDLAIAVIAKMLVQRAAAADARSAAVVRASAAAAAKSATPWARRVLARARRKLSVR